MCYVTYTHISIVIEDWIFLDIKALKNEACLMMCDHLPLSNTHVCTAVLKLIAITLVGEKTELYKLLCRVASWRSLTGNKKYINMIFYVNCISFDTFENKCSSSTGSKLNNHIKYHSSMTVILKQRSTGTVYSAVMEALD